MFLFSFVSRALFIHIFFYLCLISSITVIGTMCCSVMSTKSYRESLLYSIINIGICPLFDVFELFELRHCSRETYLVSSMEQLDKEVFGKLLKLSEWSSYFEIMSVYGNSSKITIRVGLVRIRGLIFPCPKEFDRLHLSRSIEAKWLVESFDGTWSWWP